MFLWWRLSINFVCFYTEPIYYINGSNTKRHMSEMEFYDYDKRAFGSEFVGS